jgi:hypothetical protein
VFVFKIECPAGTEVGPTAGWKTSNRDNYAMAFGTDVQWKNENVELLSQRR